MHIFIKKETATQCKKFKQLKISEEGAIVADHYFYFHLTNYESNRQLRNTL
jgi:hypothetical protein